MMSDGMEGMERIRRTSHTLERGARRIFFLSLCSFFFFLNFENGQTGGAVFWPEKWAAKSEGQQLAFTFCVAFLGPENGTQKSHPNFMLQLSGNGCSTGGESDFAIVVVW